MLSIRNITILRRRTSVRLEPEMWRALGEIARRERCTVHDICTLIQLNKRPDASLTAAIRVFLMLYYRAAATEEGHRAAGHGDFNRMVRRGSGNPSLLQRQPHPSADGAGSSNPLSTGRSQPGPA
jgi:predicted DNA-binding ribbon-helix-helix protein